MRLRVIDLAVLDCFPRSGLHVSIPTLAKQLKHSERDVYASVDLLVTLGLLNWNGGTEQTGMVYRLTMDGLCYVKKGAV